MHLRAFADERKEHEPPECREDVDDVLSSFQCTAFADNERVRKGVSTLNMKEICMDPVVRK